MTGRYFHHCTDAEDEEFDGVHNGEDSDDDM